MCLAVPMRIKKINQNFAKVEISGLIRHVNVQMLPGLKKGDYVIVHAGFAIQKIDPLEAKKTLKVFNEICR
ncbi:MAG: HypC/HybG/HupF family hydrogenase formation chaperone [Candidatus Omnitrophota bacterium]|jgi:hydrogenase expression/formation protein HypC|nr:MAG: HypC/HybG/HupF family hydrogenase formation chaperone [Candidatus Omnitrophota bacterium]